MLLAPSTDFDWFCPAAVDFCCLALLSQHAKLGYERCLTIFKNVQRAVKSSQMW
jgi:hypothetical protein